MWRVIRYLRATGFRRGFLGGSRPWFAIWAALALARWLKQKSKGEEEVAYRTELRPGEQLVVTHGLPPVKR